MFVIHTNFAMDIQDKTKQELINELKELQQAYDSLKASIKSDLPKSEMRHSGLLNHLDAGIVVHAPDTSIVMNNHRASELLGLTDQQLRGKAAIDPVWKFIHENNTPLTLDEYPVNKVVSGKKAIKTQILGIHRPVKNDVVWVTVNGFPVLENNGQISEIVISFIDITERKQSELLLQEKNKEIEAKNEEYQQLNEELIYANQELYHAKLRAEESEEKTRDIANLLPQIIFESDSSGNLTYLNNNAFKVFGYPEDYPILGKSSLDFYTPESRLKAIENIGKRVAGYQGSLGNEYVMVRRDGSTFPALVYSNPIIKGGKPIGLRGIIVNITERKKAEEELENSMQILEKTMSSLLDAVLIIDADTVKITDCNPATSTIFGYSRQEIIGQTTEFLHVDEESLAVFRKHLNSALAAGIEFMFLPEFKMKHKDGTVFFSEHSVVPLKNREGHRIGWVSVVRDITERKQAVEELMAQRHTYEQIIEQSLAGYWDWDLPTGYEYLSPTFKKMFGYEDNEIENSAESWQKLIFSEDLPIVIEKFNQHIESKGKIPFYTEVRYHHKDGSIVWVICTGKVIEWDDNEKAIRMIGCHIDITTRKNIEQELIKAKERAQESDLLKSAFLANMSHEIRTPMNGILGFAGLLKEPNLSGEQQQKYIRIIEKSGARMLNIINDIVDISKIESGQMRLDIKESNINEQVEYIYTFFKPEVEAKGMKISFKTGLPAKEAIIKTDREKVYSILTNLVKNAIKYSKEGTIEFGYDVAGKIHEFCLLKYYVKDTGIGIPKERQEAIFERFVQADIIDVQARQGAGLGLAISKAYIEMLGGKIWVESEVGGGSAFYFTLPYNPEPTKVEPVQQHSPSEIVDHVRKLKILIVEDDDVSEVLMAISINEFGTEILNARTGVEAIEVCKRNPDIDLVLMDIRMPQMGGYEATRLIREFNKEVVIIAQTAYGLAGDKEKAIEAGCNDYISKPINKDELQTLMLKYFGN